MSGRAIFLAVGTQLPFDRLTKALDGWCGATGRGSEVFGQVGHLDETHVTPVHFEWQARIGPEDYTQRMQNADVIVAKYATYPLTTLAVSPYELGRKLARVLLERMNEPNMPPSTTLVPAKLVERETTGAPPAK